MPYETEIDILTAEKERVIETYRLKTEKLKQEIVSSEAKLKGLNEQFKAEYDGKIKALEKLESVTKQEYADMDKQSRDLEKNIKDFEAQKESFYESVESMQKDLAKENAKNESILKTVQDLNIKTSLIEQSIRSQKQELAVDKKDIVNRINALGYRENALSAKEKDYELKAAELKRKMDSADEEIERKFKEKAQELQEFYDKNARVLERVNKFQREKFNLSEPETASQAVEVELKQAKPKKTPKKTVKKITKKKRIKKEK